MARNDFSIRRYLIRTPIERLNACVNASVLLISNEKISLPDIAVNGVSDPKACAIPIQIRIHQTEVYRRER